MRLKSLGVKRKRGSGGTGGYYGLSEEASSSGSDFGLPSASSPVSVSDSSSDRRGSVGSGEETIFGSDDVPQIPISTAGYPARLVLKCGAGVMTSQHESYLWRDMVRWGCRSPEVHSCLPHPDRRTCDTLDNGSDVCFYTDSFACGFRLPLMASYNIF